MTKVILASASPRRSELLSNLGIEFDVFVSDADESSVDTSIETSLYVQELALLKASAVGDILLKENNHDYIIIAADTIVSKNGNILGKPKDYDDAVRMLTDLSSDTHQVYTGICVMRLSDGYTVCDHRKTDVTFLPLSNEKICAYVSTGEPMDKAGAYGIQGLGATLVEKISGDYFNVVGLPMEALASLLEKEFELTIM